MQATLSLCVAGYAVQEFRQYRYDSQLGIGVGIFLGIPAYDVVFVNVSSGCSAPVTNAAAAPAGRRHLAQTPVPAPPPPDPSCLNVTAGQPLPAGCVPALYNASSSITAMLDITLPVARATTLLAALDALGNGTSPGAANLTALLRTVGLSQLQGLRLPSDAEGASLLAAAALVLASQPPPPPPPRAPWPPRPPRPPPDAPGTVDKDKSGKFSSKSTRRKDAALDAGSSAVSALHCVCMNAYSLVGVARRAWLWPPSRRCGSSCTPWCTPPRRRTSGAPPCPSPLSYSVRPMRRCMPTARTTTTCTASTSPPPTPGRSR
jgi:hypothetical protein